MNPVRKFFQQYALPLAAFLLLGASLATSWFFRVAPSVALEQKKLERYVHRQQADAAELMQDSALLRKLIQRTESLAEFEQLANKAYGFFLYAETLTGNEELLFWNTHKILPPQADYDSRDEERFVQRSNGGYLLIKKNIVLTGMSNRVQAFILVPLLQQYNFQSSAYLNTQFAHDAQAAQKIALVNRPTRYPVRSAHGELLFYIDRIAHVAIPPVDVFTTALRVAAFFILLFYLLTAAATVVHRKGVLWGLTLLVAGLTVLRCVLYFLPYSFSFRQNELFSPTIYASNALNRSLGDLLINALFFYWLAVFLWRHHDQMPLPKRVGHRLVLTFASVALLLFMTLQLADVVRSLVADSKISFNVTDFSSLDYFSVLGFMALSLLSIGYYFFSRILYQYIFGGLPHLRITVFFAIGFFGLLLITLGAQSKVSFHLPVVGWLLLYTFLISRQYLRWGWFRVDMASVLFWIFVFSVSIAAILLHENRKKEWVVRQSIADRYNQLTDPSSERTLSIALAYLDNDFLVQNFDRFKDPVQNRFLRDSIVSENIAGYLNNYDTRVYVYNADGQPINNPEPLQFSDIDDLFRLQSKPTGIPDLYFHQSSYDRFSYITKRGVTDSGESKGYFFIVSTPKQYSTDALYPELFKRMSTTALEFSPAYSYAVYERGLLISATNKYPFRIHLLPDEVPREEFERRERGVYDEMWYRAGKDKVVIVSRKKDSVIESITLFSYLFCAFLLLVGLMQFTGLLLRLSRREVRLSQVGQFNIRSQVHATIIFISTLSFIIIGIATISFFISRYNRSNIDKLSRTSDIMIQEMQKQVVNFGRFDDVLTIYDSVNQYNLQKLINEVSDIHDVDVNVYDTLGHLQASSEQEVYKRGILSSQMHPTAFFHLYRLGEAQYVQEEKVGKLEYLSNYAAIRNDAGLVYAYLNIPYFLSQVDLNQEISNFFVTIINLNAFIFLIAGVIALFITNRITRSFSIIGNKMREIQLGKANEEIAWERDDEIGELIKQYNKMVHQLENSATALAKSEREGAWREMARQVAHEIKNPLTPMKLSIQYLQKAIAGNQPNVQQLAGGVANTLVEQIDHLSRIAADFARFANIGIRNVETFDLHTVLESLYELNKSNSEISITWNRVTEPVMVSADKTQMNRLFTNLITNAVDACTQGQCTIQINEQIIDGHVVVELKDNGEGIPAAMQSKIFTPNFTTKSSGTGLGLAMSKSIVEQAGGEIWFATEAGIGTSFYVQLPLQH